MNRMYTKILGKVVMVTQNLTGNRKCSGVVNKAIVKFPYNTGSHQEFEGPPFGPIIKEALIKINFFYEPTKSKLRH